MDFRIIHRRGRGRRRNGRERLHEISPAYNAYQLAPLHHGKPLDVMRFHSFGDARDRRVRRHRHDLRRHHVACLPAAGLHIFGEERVVRCEELQPARPRLLGAELNPPEQVVLSNDANQFAMIDTGTPLIW